MIFPYFGINYQSVPTKQELEDIVDLLEKATKEIVTDLELLIYLARKWDINIKNKYNHLIYCANKLNWHTPSHMVVQCSKIKYSIEKLEAVYKEAERDKLF